MPHNEADSRNATSLAPSAHLPGRPDGGEATGDDIVDWFDLDSSERGIQQTPDELACLSLTSVGDPARDDDRDDRWM